MPAQIGGIPSLSVHGALALRVGGRKDPLPDWASWFIWLGQWLRVQAPCEGRRVAVVRAATRRTAAAFALLGVMLESARFHDDSLDWGALRSLAPGTRVFWRERAGGGSKSHSGSVVGEREIGGQDFLVVSVEGGRKSQPLTRSFARQAALSYGITLGTVTAKTDERLTGAERLIRAAVGGFSPGWIRSVSTECVLVTERTSFLSDLTGTRICAGGVAEEPFVDVLAISDPVGRTHGKTRLVSPRQDGLLDAAGQVTILDGASAFLRLPDSGAGSVLAILDPAEFDEEVEQTLMTFMGSANDAYVNLPSQGLTAPPPSTEVVVFGLQSSDHSET